MQQINTADVNRLERRSFLKSCLATAGTLALGLKPVLVKGAEADGRKPNIILIFTDDQGYADLGCQFAKDVRTPYIDALAAGGVRCTDGYVTAPQCMPSRAGILTGRYQQRFGFEFNSADAYVPREQPFLSELLKKAGYVTGMSGKWHVGDEADYLPPARGFDDYFCMMGVGPTYFSSHGGDDVKLGPGQRMTATKEYRLDAQTDAAVRFIRRHADQPFFLYLPYFAPHVPLEAPEKYLSRFANVTDPKRRMCLAMLSAVDDGVGRVRQTLEELGIEENTLIFLISDNGAPLDNAWNGSLNDPLAGKKGTLYEGGIRVPFIVYWKGRLKPTVYRQPVISLDVAATALALAQLPPNPQADGVDLMPHLTGVNSQPPHEILYWRWGGQKAVRQGNWKLYRRGDQNNLLFNLEQDMEEKQDLATDQPDRVRQLSELLDTWDRQLLAPRWGTEPGTAKRAAQQRAAARNKAAPSGD